MTKNIDDELKALIGKILRIDITELSIPLYGELLEVQPYWIVIEKRNGKHRMISKARIIGIEPVRGYA
jgi:hypothetical protein